MEAEEEWGFFGASFAAEVGLGDSGGLQGPALVYYRNFVLSSDCQRLRLVIKVEPWPQNSTKPSST